MSYLKILLDEHKSGNRSAGHAILKLYESLQRLNIELYGKITGLNDVIESQKETNLAIINKLEKMKCCCNCKYVAVACDSDGCQSKGGFDDWEIRDWEYEVNL